MRRSTPLAAPLVTVVIPAFNAEATLAETLESVAAQTYHNLEILIIDDGSIDRTAEIAAAFCAAQGGRAQLIRKANGGVASARNLGLREAAGEWVAPIDADDLWHPTKIAKQVAVATSFEVPPAFVYCSYHCIDLNGTAFDSPPDIPPGGRIFHQHAYENFVGNGSGLMLARDPALAAGGYDQSMPQGCEDLLLQLKLARDAPVGCVPEHLVGYRVHGSAMSNDLEKMTESWEVVLAWLSGNAPTLPRRIVRWSRGMRCFDMAQTYALTGRWARTLPLLARAVRYDPVRCGLHVCDRLLRVVIKPFRASKQERRGPRFDALDPAAPLERDPNSFAGLTPLLDRLHRKRLARLAKIDRREMGSPRP